MDNIYAWLGIAPHANEAEILAAIARKKQGYQINTTQEVHIKQVLLTPRLRRHHDARVAAFEQEDECAMNGFASLGIDAQGTLLYTPADNRILPIRTKLKKSKPHPNNILYLILAVALVVFLGNVWLKLSAM